ncbi:MAG: hypothetical protein GY723_10400 [bacterium]|nr:hypothetical protein [bacterium]MCP5070108.1 hypothetical protein [bacterium]
MSATEPRSAPELVSLLLELARVVKARSYFEPGDPRLGPVFEHTRRVWLADLQRHGPLELTIESGRLEQGGTSVPIDGRLAAPLADWLARGVWRLRVEPDADGDAMAGLVEVLALPNQTVSQEGGAGPALARRVPEGVHIETPDDAPGLPVPKEPIACEQTPALQPAELPLAEDDAPTLENIVEQTGEPTDPITEPFEGDHPGSDTEQTLPNPSIAALDRDESGPEDTQPVALPLGESSGDTTESGPGMPPPSDTAATLLREIEGSAGGDSYAELVDGLLRLVEDHAHGLGLAATLRILAALAVECDAKRAVEEQEVARAALRQLVTDERLDAVIDHAAEGGADAERAAAVLAQLDEDGIRALAVCTLTEADPERAERLASTLLARGPSAAEPPVLEALTTPERDIARRAIGLAERIGTQDSVAGIADQLRGDDAFVREAAGAALARLGHPDGANNAQALRALARALSATDPQLPPLAIECLAATGNPRAVPALASALHAAVEAREIENARDLIRALGELGRPEAAVELGKLVLRRNFLGRKRLHELKLAATRALGRLPGDEAVGVLSQAARLRDTQVREAAQTALERRSR